MYPAAVMGRTEREECTTWYKDKNNKLGDNERTMSSEMDTSTHVFYRLCVTWFTRVDRYESIKWTIAAPEAGQPQLWHAQLRRVGLATWSQGSGDGL